MFTSAELIEALRRRQRRSLRPQPPVGEFPPGWRAWFATLREHLGTIHGAAAESIVALLARRELRSPPPRMPTLNDWQAFTTLWRQQWHPASDDERGQRIAAMAVALLTQLFFAIFLLFALSFFGMFEITLPSRFVNRIDKQADRGGYVGIFFMAFTLVLVGFSCTGPIAGTILLQAASGEAIMPIVGMLGFSLAFAIPFTLFAIFPGWLSSLPKSGGWMNSVKVVLGFLELALALKFLSMVDQVYHWGLLDREVYLALWIAIFALLGFYLLGKLVFPHEEKPERVGVPRLLSAVLVFGFVVYLIPGLFGAPLKSLSGYLPPMGSQDFNLMQPAGIGEADALPEGYDTPKYGDLLELPHGIQGYFDYEQALASAKEQNKPLFIDFTGHGCVNCREMEASVWSDPKVLKRLKEDYVVVALYVDEKTELPREEWYISAYDEKLKSTMGKQNLDFMIQKLNANAQPYYTLVGEDGKLLNAPKGYDLNVDAFVEFLDEGQENFYGAEL